MGIRRSRRRAGSAVLATVAAVAVLAGCSVAPWQEEAPWQITPTETPTPDASETLTVEPGPVESVPNELAGGTTVRELSAGNIDIEVTYWSTLNMSEWAPGASKPLSFSLVADLREDRGERVYLSSLTMTTAVRGPGGVLPAPPVLVDDASVSPGYLVKAPYTYSQTFIVPAVDPRATSVSFSITYELLLQTTPTSSEYSKQTASDTVTVALA